MKICKKCGGVEFYSSGQCKSCHKAWRELNSEKVTMYKAKHSKTEKAKENAKIKRSEKREILNKLANERRTKKRWEGRERPIQLTPEEKKEKIKQNRKVHIEKNKDLLAIQRHEWYLLNKVEASKKSEIWRKENPDAVKVHGQNRRARKKGNGGKLSKGLFDKLFKLQKGKCACCKTNLTKVKVHMDHVIPIAKGGLNIDSNIQLLCQLCNQKKHAKDPIDFMQQNGFLI